MLAIIPANNSSHSAIIAKLIQDSFAEQANLLNLHPDQFPNFVGFETTERTIYRLTHGDDAVLAMVKGETIGTVSYQIVTEQPTIGFIKRLAILPAYRGYKYGELLMHYAEEQLATHGINRAEISIVAEFVNLHRYYNRLGYLDGKLTSVSSLPFPVQYLYKPLR
ncbi:MAG: GNAT family N-acetyltransferase [Methanomassiliicoccales archaeon]